MSNEVWRQASKREPCPICEKPDWCSLTGVEGAIEVVVCMRVESDKQCKNGGWLHRLRESTGQYSPPPAKPKTIYDTANAAVSSLEVNRGKRSALWTYHDIDDDPVGVIVRWDRPDGKDILPVSRNGMGWVIGGMTEPRPLYCLPDLAGADRVFICEGEKAVDAARSIGLTATTSPHGSMSAAKADWTPLAGKECVILPDKDEPGYKYADDVAAILKTMKPYHKIQIVHLPGLGEHGDIVDWLAGRPDAVAARRQVESLVADASGLNDSRIDRIVSLTETVFDRCSELKTLVDELRDGGE
jgi:hypothetical protein